MCTCHFTNYSMLTRCAKAANAAPVVIVAPCSLPDTCCSTYACGRLHGLSDVLALLQILLVNGCAAGSKGKKDILEKLSGMQLFDPSCCVHDEEVGGELECMHPAAARQRWENRRKSPLCLPWRCRGVLGC